MTELGDRDRAPAFLQGLICTAASAAQIPEFLMHVSIPVISIGRKAGEDGAKPSGVWPW